MSFVVVNFDFQLPISGMKYDSCRAFDWNWITCSLSWAQIFIRRTTFFSDCENSEKFSLSTKVYNSRWSLFSVSANMNTTTSDLLHVTGHAIKFVDRNPSSSEDKLLVSSLSLVSPSKVSVMSSDDGTNHVQKLPPSTRKISRKCPIEIDSPKKRRILKRPKRFATYFSVRKPLSVPCFEFPRWLIVN